MPRSLSLTALQVNALTNSNDTILYNAQTRDVSLYGGTNLASLLTQLEIDNISGDCLTLRCNSDVDNYANFKMNSSGTFDLKINNGNKSFNIVNHNGSTYGLRLGGTLVTATATELSKLSGFTGTSTNLNYLSDVTPGTATASKALVTDANNNLSGINDLSTQNLTVAGVLVTASATELNYTDISTAGTAQAAKALVVDVNRDISNIRNLSATNLTGTLQTANQPNITSVGTLSDLTVTNAISAGNITASGQLITNVAGQGFSHNDGTINLVSYINNSLLPGIAYFGTSTNHEVQLQTNNTGRLSLKTNGDITISSTNGSTSSSTGALQVAGGAYFGANSIFNSTLRVMGQSNPTAGEGIEFGYGGSTANIYSFDRTGGTYKNINLNDKIYIKSDGTIGIGTSTPTYKLDLGSTATNMNLSLYGGLYGFGACNNNLQSFSDNGFTWHTVNSAVTGTGAAPGTQIGKLYSDGHFEASSGIRAGEYSTPSYTGSGIEMHYSTSQGWGDIFSYDRTIDTYKGLRLNANLYISLGGYVGIGTTYPLFPLHVANTTASGTSYNYYYYLGPGSTNGSTTAAPSSVSIKTDGRILVTGEVDVISDIRKKENIQYLNLNYCKSFVDIIKPISFNYKTVPDDINYGYIAQDIIKNNFTELITIHKDEGMEEFIDSDGFKSEAGYSYSVSKNDIVPILHMVVKDQQTKITNLEQKNIDLETRLSKLEAFINTLELSE